MIDQALDSQNRDKIWLSVAPFSALSITLMLVTLVGESIREALRPQAVTPTTDRRKDRHGGADSRFSL